MTAERAVILGGLAVGVVLGLAANAFEEGTARDLIHALSSIGLAVGAAVLAVRMGMRGAALAAAGFALFAVSQVAMWTTGGPSQTGSEATFAMAVLFGAPGLALAATAPELPNWCRAAGVLSAAAFAVHGLRYLGGAAVSSEDALVGFAYLLLVVAAAGWIWAVLRPRSLAARADVRPGAAIGR
ncbi:MAG: hypothetical protein ACRDPC_02100 [Solirubrobacteraceae bacterium]